MKTVYVITQNKEGKNFWHKIGVAFENRDGSLNVKLHALPINGEMHIREEYQQQRKPSQTELPMQGSGIDDDDIPF